MNQQSKNTQQAHQNRIWSYYQNEGVDSFGGAQPRLNYLIKAIGRLKKNASPRVLNIGVGNGYFELQAQKAGWSIYALDPDEVAIKRLKAANISAEVGHIERMPYEDNSFDFVVASEVLEHLDDEQRAQGIKEIARILKDGGHFMGTVPYNENLRVNMVLCPYCGEMFHRWGHHKSFQLADIVAELSPFLMLITIQKMAFVQFKGKSLFGKVKALVRLILGRRGDRIAHPNIYFLSQK